MGLKPLLLSLIKQEDTINFEVIYGENQEPIYYDPYVAFVARQVEAQQSAAAVEIDPIIQPEDYKVQANYLIYRLTRFHHKFDNLRQYFPFAYKVTDTDEDKARIQSEINEIKKFAEIILQHFLNLKSQNIYTVYAASYVNDKVFVCPAGGRENMQAIASSFANNIQSLLYNAKEIYLSEVASTFVAHLPTEGMHIHWNTALMVAASDKYNIQIAKDSLANPNIIYKEEFLSKLAQQENSLKSVEHIVRIITDNIIRDFPVKFDEDPNKLANQIAQITSKLSIIDPIQAKYILDKIYDTEDWIIYKYHDNYQEVVTAFVTKSLHEQGYLDAGITIIDDNIIIPTEGYLYNYTNYEYSRLDFEKVDLIKSYLSNLYTIKEIPTATEIVLKLDKNGNSLIANYFKEVLLYYRNTEQIANLLKQSLISNNHEAFYKIIEEKDLQKNIQASFNNQQLVEDLIKYSAQSRGKDVFEKILEYRTEAIKYSILKDNIKIEEPLLKSISEAIKKSILNDPVKIQGLLLESIEYDNHELFDFILSITEADIAKVILILRDPQTDTTLLDLSIIKNRPLFTKLIANTAKSFGILKDLVSATNNNLENSALLAVKKNNIQAISAILKPLSPDEREKILNFEYSRGFTPLTYAIYHNQIQVISAILELLSPDEREKILNFEDYAGWTPLSFAIYNNQIEAISAILKPLSPEDQLKLLLTENVIELFKDFIYDKKTEVIKGIIISIKDEALLEFLNKSKFNIDDLIKIFSPEKNSEILKFLNEINNTISDKSSLLNIKEIIEPIIKVFDDFVDYLQATVLNNLNVNLLANIKPVSTSLPAIEGSIIPSSSPPYSMAEESFSRESILNGFTGVSYVCKTMDLIFDFNKLYYQPTSTNLQTLLTDAHQLSTLYFGSNPYLYNFMWYKLETDYAEGGYQKAFTNYFLTTGFMVLSTNIGDNGIYIRAAVAFISLYNSYKHL